MPRSYLANANLQLFHLDISFPLTVRGEAIVEASPAPPQPSSKLTENRVSVGPLIGHELRRTDWIRFLSPAT
jgi:hypothetical protein